MINRFGIGGAELVFEKQAKYFVGCGVGVILKTLHEFGFSGLTDWREYKRLLLFIDEQQITHIYATLDWSTVVARVVKWLRPNLRVVIRESGMADRKSWKFKLLDWLLNFKTDAVIAVSKEVQESLCVYQKHHCRKIEVVENGVEIKSDCDNLVATKDGGGPIVFLHVGSMQNDNKGQAELIKMFREVAFLYPKLDWRLVLVGDGARRQALLDLTATFELSHRVELPGLLLGLELMQRYLEADVFLLASLSEGFPNVVLEAMSHCLPVIAFEVGGINRAVINELTGFVIPRGDRQTYLEKICFLADRVDKRRAMGQSACERATKCFNFEAKADRVMSIVLGYEI